MFFLAFSIDYVERNSNRYGNLQKDPNVRHVLLPNKYTECVGASDIN